MEARRIDIAIAGGGLSGALIALALRRRRPDLSIVLIEQGARIGGNHRWSWFASDLTPDGEDLLAGLRTTRWDGGYDVAFPGHSRRLSTHYRSLASADLDAGLRRVLPIDAIRCQSAIAVVDGDGVTIAGGERITARAVIDCRGAGPSPHLGGGWQVFMGHHVRTARPHGIERPTIMDARVSQLGVVEPAAYRFVYVLPLDRHEIFVEDTYYADRPRIDASVLAGRIGDYCASRGWHGELLGSETGVLPVITNGDFRAFQAAARIPGVAMAGARGGFVHPLTSYTMPHAVAVALAIAANADLPGARLAERLEAMARAHWRRTAFYRLLGRMLFGAARPDARFRVFERFYRLPEPLIERFYAARSTVADRARILCGKPPVPILGALRAMLASGAPMVERGGDGIPGA
ncbi:MAG: lycopene beta-cyclase CrtY [Novosphingobium sp.]